MSKAKAGNAKPAPVSKVETSEAADSDAADASKLTLSIQIEGLSLWIKRDTHIDVLFPDDRLAILAPKAHHYVTLDGPGVSNEVLVGECVDLTGLDIQAPQLRLVSPLGWLPVDVEENSVANDPNAALLGTSTVATLRLPLGMISAISDEMYGPFAYGGQLVAVLDYGVVWTVKVANWHPLTAQWIDHATSLREARPFGNVPATARLAQFRIRNLSANDRRSDTEIQTGEALTETQFIGHLSRKFGLQLPVAPVYMGRSRSALESKAMNLRPTRPCPPTFARPFA